MNYKISNGLMQRIEWCGRCDHTDRDTHITCKAHARAIKIEKCKL